MVKTINLYYEKNKFINIVKLYFLKFFDIFYIGGDKLTMTNAIKYCIYTNNAKPNFTKIYH